MTNTLKLNLKTNNNEQLINICGIFDANLKIIQQKLAVGISYRGNDFSVVGVNNKIAKKVLDELQQISKKSAISNNDVYMTIKKNQLNNKTITINTPKKIITISNANQKKYIQNIVSADCNFVIGPAGCGKTYLAVVKAVELIEQAVMDKIILVRPVVEAGEKLGFLPGDLNEKVNPYLRPIYDALYEMLGCKKTNKLIEQNIIEIAPLAFMRGRTLSNSFIILDEAQNTTNEQMKMFLTRLGFNSKMVITGDITQIDLPKNIKSGLLIAEKILKSTKGVCFNYFNSNDVMRHSLVQRIINAYEQKT